MRFTLPTRRPASPVPPQPRQPPPQAELPAELDVEESPQPIAGARRASGRVVTAVAAVVIAVVAGRCDRREAVNIELESW